VESKCRPRDGCLSFFGLLWFGSGANQQRLATGLRIDGLILPPELLVLIGNTALLMPY